MSEDHRFDNVQELSTPEAVVLGGFGQVPPSITYQEVWDKLSQIDVSHLVKQKNNLSYLSWAGAWKIMMENFPEIKYFFEEEQVHKDGTVTVHCTVYIQGISRTMFLPVMTGFKNTAAPNPSARDIGDAKMRCLTKAFAMLGLGHYIYEGEDLPSSNERTRKAKQGKSDGQLPPKISNEDERDINSDAAKETAPIVVHDDATDLHRAVEETLEVFLVGATTVDELKEFWAANKDGLRRLEKDDTERFERLINAFKEKKSSILEALNNNKKD